LFYKTFFSLSSVSYKEGAKTIKKQWVSTLTLFGQFWGSRFAIGDREAAWSWRSKLPKKLVRGGCDHAV